MFEYTFKLETVEDFNRMEKECRDREDVGEFRYLCPMVDVRDDWENYGKKSVLVYGKLQALFGKCIYESENYEEKYSYFLTTQNAAGETFCFEVYSGPTGPAIQGFQNEESQKAVEALLEIINSAQPADYAYEGYYYDGPCRIREGIQDGVPYYEETPLVPGLEELEEAYGDIMEGDYENEEERQKAIEELNEKIRIAMEEYEELYGEPAFEE